MKEYIKKTTVLIAVTLTLAACQPSGTSNNPSTDTGLGNPGTPQNPLPEEPEEPENPAVPFENYAKLPWENSGKPRAWSLYLYEQIDKSSSVYFKGASDITSFCPRYYSLNNQEQTEFWAQLFVAMIKYESSYNPLTRFKEPGGNIDPITKQSLYSEGLFQLSYQDTQWMPECAFDWSKDKLLATNDPKRTILDPYKNMHCGVLIMKRQLNKHNTIAIGSGAYWAVIKTNSSYNKLPAIRGITTALPYCKN